MSNANVLQLLVMALIRRIGNPYQTYSVASRINFLVREVFARCVVAMLAAVLLATPVRAEVEDVLWGGVLSLDPPTAENQTFQAGEYGVSDKNGAATYSFSIVVPPGRNGMQPSLALSYSSRAPLRGGVAAGWSMEVPAIRRDRAAGTLGEERYTVSFQGSSGILVSVPDVPLYPENPTYRAEINTAFTRFERLVATGGWLARDES